MKTEQKLFVGICPICDREYTLENNITKHHIFPKYWYGSKGTVTNLRWKVTVIACMECHVYDFHAMFKMRLKAPWLVSDCVQNWVKFCKTKGKDAYVLYPKLLNLQPML